MITFLDNETSVHRIKMIYPDSNHRRFDISKEGVKALHNSCSVDMENKKLNIPPRLSFFKIIQLTRK